MNLTNIRDIRIGMMKILDHMLLCFFLILPPRRSRQTDKQKEKKREKNLTFQPIFFTMLPEKQVLSYLA